MRIQDKRSILPTLAKATQPICIDLGCGPLKKNASWIGIDALDFEGVDLVGDVFEVLSAFPTDSVDEIFSSHFFEHIQALPLLLQETQRVLKPGGRMTVIVPHFSNPYFYSDYTHKNFFGLYSFSYLVDEFLFKRKVPKYQVSSQLLLEKVHLKFQSPFPIRGLLYKAWGLLFNSATYLQELYEENFSRIIYCYELHFHLTKKKKSLS